ncbi:AraC family transcriptional regulator N-terminal domain-containing protein [Planctomycetaceae bacterium SH248]
MKTNSPQRQFDRFEADRLELAERIGELTTQLGSKEVRPGIFLNRITVPNEPVYATCDPSFCVISQGRKIISLGDESYRYDPAHYLITTVRLPLMGEVMAASIEEPYLSFRLVLDPAVFTSILIESGQTHFRDSVRALDVSALDGNLLDATLRLVRLLDNDLEFDLLSPLVIREIAFRLLSGPQGVRMCHLARLGGSAHRITRAIERLRKDFNKPLKIEQIATELEMSVSGFHSHFKTATTMSPLQFQKQLRLQEARRLMLKENLDAAEAGFRVGYEDASQFSREYKRHFGLPPIRDVERVKEIEIAPSPS